MNESEHGVRLHKFLASAGVGSRRICEEWIAEGRVQVNGETITSQGKTVNPAKDVVRFDGQKVLPEQPAYFLVYKPKGVVCTTKDQFGRKSVIDLVRDRHDRRLFPVGRLEEDSEGLILVTNDGKFTNKLARLGHPLRHTYFVRLRGRLTQEQLDKVRNGIWLSDGRSGEMQVKVLRLGKKVSTVLVSPQASQHRLLRRVFAKIGVLPDKVVRVRFGPLTTDGLKKGGQRRLSEEEVQLLLDPPPEARMERAHKRTRAPHPTVVQKQKRDRRRAERAERREAARRDKAEGVPPPRNARSGGRKGPPKGKGPAKGPAKGPGGKGKGGGSGEAPRRRFIGP